jgi:hypothetical protein
MSDDPNAVATPTFADSIAEEHREFAKNKAWDSPDKVLRDYRQLEQFVGAEKAGRGLVLPGEKATPEEITAFRSRAASVAGGIPDSPDGYEIKLPDGFPDPEFGKVASSLLHKYHVPKGDAQGLMGDFMAMVSGGEADRVKAEQAEFVKQETALKTEWGAEFDKNAEIAKRGMSRLGLSAEVIDQMESKAGFASVIKAMHKAGVMLGEGKFIDNDNGEGVGGETLDSLMAQRLKLTKDPDWGKRFHANEASARTEWTNLEAKIAAAKKKVG